MISKLPGHQKIRKTVRYMHLTRGSSKNAAERVPDSLVANLDNLSRDSYSA